MTVRSERPTDERTLKSPAAKKLEVLNVYNRPGGLLEDLPDRYEPPKRTGSWAKRLEK